MMTAEDEAAARAASPATAPSARAWRRWLGTALLVAAVACVFGNAIDNDFVYDDRLLIVDNPAVRAPLADLQALRFYRPLRTLSYRLDYAIGGLDPRVFHVSNLVYHTLTTLLVRAVLVRAGASPSAAVSAALVFAVHPVQTDAVTYAAGRRDILCGLFFTAGLLAYLRYRDTKSRTWLATAMTSYILAILAKEMAVTLPLVCHLYDRFSTARTRSGGSARDSLPGATPIARAARGGVINGLLAAAAVGGGIVVLAVYGSFLRRVIAVTGWHGGSATANFATVVRVWAHYLGLIAWPARLSADYSQRGFAVSTTVFEGRVLAAAVLLAALAVAAAWRWRRGGLAGFGAAFWAVTLLPVSQLVPYRELLAEHYLYIPMIGVACVVADVMDTAGVRAGARRWTLAAVGLVAVALAARTIVRNRDWRDAVTLWSATVATVPECARARFNLGQAYFQRVRFEDAEREWLAAAAITPGDADTMRALALLHYRQGHLDDAERWIAAALTRAGEDGRVQSLAGWIALDHGDAARALQRFDAALAQLSDASAPAGRVARERMTALEGARLGRERAAAAVARP